MSSNAESVKEHYISYHRIDSKNYFFNFLFKKGNIYLCRDCIRCGEFLTTTAEKYSHNFINHYEEGKETPADEKPVKIINNGEIIIYQISYNDHKEHYDFFDAEKVVNEILINFRNLFKPSAPCLFKADFAIENKQDVPDGILNTAEIKSLLYWTTNVYRAVYFNEYVISGIRKDIMKRVINNRLTGSSWYFNRFSHLNV